jgi:EpsI family protein
MLTRIMILVGVLAAGSALVAKSTKTEVVPPRQSLQTFPIDIEGWRGQDDQPFASDIMAVLGVDDYISRLYRSKAALASLYIGYYESQRQGDTMHSPLNCLPGAGWEPVSKDYLSIPVRADIASDALQNITVNRYVIRKGLDEQLVLYWYQSHGRVIANEYRSKLFMVYDAVRLNRTDAALVRVITPRAADDPQSAETASRTGVDFVKMIFPLLDKYLPS